MDFEHESTAPRYRVCAAGFRFSALALGLLGLSEALRLWAFLTGDQGLIRAMHQPWYTWGVELPITAGALLGSYLLWGRWTDSSWQRRTGLLVLLNLFDSAYWGLSQASAMGVPMADLGHEWLFHNGVMIFGWIEFILFADLAAEVASDLGVKAAADAGRTARRFTGAGLALSILFFATQTFWQAGWPLMAGPMPNLTGVLMSLGISFLRVIGAVQVTTLCAIAAFACRRTARQLSLDEYEPAGASHNLDPMGRPEFERDTGRAQDEFPF